MSDELRLTYGGHTDRSQGMCLMEAVAFIAGEEHSDRPACVSPLLGAFGRSLNDGLFFSCLDRLVPYVPRLVDTRRPDLEIERACLLTDWAVRCLLPQALERLHYPSIADRVRELAPITDDASAEAAEHLLRPMSIDKLVESAHGMVGRLRVYASAHPHPHAETFAQELGGYAGSIASRTALTHHASERDEIRASVLSVLDCLLKVGTDVG